MITKFKIFECADEVLVDGKDIGWSRPNTIPFIVVPRNFRKPKVYFGDANTHMDIVSQNDLEWISKRYSGRMWLDYKIVSFWSLDTDKVEEMFKNIQKQFNKKNTKQIDFFDGEWRIEVILGEINIKEQEQKIKDEENKYIKYLDTEYIDYNDNMCILVPITDYIKINNDAAEIESDDEELQKHLARVKAKKKL